MRSTRSADRGPRTEVVIVVDASCLYEVVRNGTHARAVAQVLAADDDQAAPHVVDVEVFSLIRRDYLERRIDRAQGAIAVELLRNWPGERYGERQLLARAWDLRDSVRGWDAAYVALAEALDATLVTRDARLARAMGPRCDFRVI